ncbi:MAG: HPF/RaiA family ribosome-associated protein [Acidiferrobacterales bacterium]
MEIDIQARNFSLTDALRAHVERRLRFALARNADHIQRVVVRLSDINGPRGGADKCCHIQVVLRHLPEVVTQDTEADLYVAIYRALDRAGRTVARGLARQRELGRSAGA